MLLIRPDIFLTPVCCLPNIQAGTGSETPAALAYNLRIFISTRWLRLRPSSVPLEKSGLRLPYPL